MDQSGSIMRLVDSFGRVATDLRVSITDRCDLRCTYCMPEDGLKWIDNESILTFDEIERAVRVAITCGIDSVRLTGGEPLVRHNVAELVLRLSKLGLRDMSMTTNGTRLARHAESLKQSGLGRVNVSLDSLDKHKFEKMTRRDQLANVIEGIEAAHKVGLDPVKLNSVVMRDVNDDESLQFAELARRTNTHVRFIEYMPLGAGDQWSKEAVVPSAEIIERITEKYSLQKDESASGPATVFNFVDGAQGSIGFIPSVTEPFCSSCDRMRLTADGQLRSCLFSSNETDLRTILRNGSTDQQLAEAMQATIAAKQAGHKIGSPLFIQPKRSMSRIGG